MMLQSEQTVLSLSNATALATNIVKEISGTEVANTLNGSRLTRAALGSLVLSRIHANYSRYTKNEVKK